MDIKQALLQRLDHARAAMQSLFAGIDHDKFIYPNWTLKELLDHFTGWDELVFASIEARALGDTSIAPKIDGIDNYNAESVSRRSGTDFASAYDRFISSRARLMLKIQDMDPEELALPFSLPWGGAGTISQIVEIFAHHEEQHSADLLHWLNDPDHHVI